MVSRFSILAYLIAIRLIFPIYANIGGLNIITLLNAAIYLLAFCWAGGCKSNFSYSLRKFPFLWFFLLVWGLQIFADSGIYEGLMYIFNTMLFCYTMMFISNSTEEIGSLPNFV